MPTLFDPIELGAISAPNRILMAPLTRARATPDHVPTEIMVEYYVQRAGAGLIISEATGISLAGLPWPRAPGIWNQRQVLAWKPITTGVHQAGGRIICQLWHGGRVVNPCMPGRATPVSASATTAPGYSYSYDGKVPHAQARALEIDELPGIVNDYVQAAEHAMQAGFDGVQLHSANGYLIDQFLCDESNLRIDAYGGSIDNRILLLHECTAGVAHAIGADRTAVRISPNGERKGLRDSRPQELFTEVARMLSDIGIAFLEVREAGLAGTHGKGDGPALAPALRKVFTGPLVLNSDYTHDGAQSALDGGAADAVSFGRAFISNPDLPARLAHGIALRPDDVATWYSQGPNGYIDYSAFKLL